MLGLEQKQPTDKRSHQIGYNTGFLNGIKRGERFGLVMGLLWGFFIGGITAIIILTLSN